MLNDQIVNSTRLRSCIEINIFFIKFLFNVYVIVC